MSQESEISLRVVPSLADSAAPPGEGDCSAAHGWVLGNVKVRQSRGCTCQQPAFYSEILPGVRATLPPAFCVRCVQSHPSSLEDLSEGGQKGQGHTTLSGWPF